MTTHVGAPARLCPMVTIDDIANPAVREWLELEAIARKEPSIPVWRPRTKRQKAAFLRADAQWRALLANARDLRPAGLRPTPSKQGSVRWS